MSQQQPDESARLEEFVQRQVDDAVRRRRAQEAADTALRAATLAADTDRDLAAGVLSQAFADGRLTSEEHADRTTRAFTARTLGELDQVLTGLQVPVAPAAPRRLRKALFWIVTVVTSPFLLVGAGFTLAGSDVGDHVFGIVLLTLFAPGLYALFRWAWPRANGASRMRVEWRR